MTEMAKRLIVITGPTASGKTRAAIHLARACSSEIISADSRQLYKELNIGVARPSEEELKAVPHHFIGSVSIRDPYTVSDYERDAITLLEKLFARHETLFLAGGSGLFIRAVCEGMDEIPESDPAIRADLIAGFRKYGIQYLRNRLIDLDPDYYSETDTSNPHRLIRALEVCISTGRPFSSFRTGQAKTRPFSITRIGIDIPREELYSRIDQRVDRMMEAGLLEEARGLYPYRELNALNTVGYKELFSYFDGLVPLDAAIETIKMNTRRYAKRQMTWFRKEPGIRWIPVKSPSDYPDLLNAINQ